MATLITKEKRREIEDLVLKVISDCNIKSLPISLKDILKHYNIYLLDTLQAKEYGLMDKVYYDFNGELIFLNDYVFIIFNERHTKERSRWNISCFIAYFLLNFKEYNEINEAAANYFTKKLLIPLAVLDYMNICTVNQISKACKISKQSAKITVKDLDKFKQNKITEGLTLYDTAILKNYTRTELQV